LTVPPHSKGGRKLRLKGRGIPAASATGAAGDLYVVLELVLPPARTAQAQESYQRMAKDLAFDPRAEQEANP
jgi:curved DNA-binding protein